MDSWTLRPSGPDIAEPKWKKRFDGQLALAGPLGPEDLKKVPAKRGVFLLEDPAGKPILLATAAGIRSRMRYKLADPDPDAPASRRADLREIATCLRWRLTSSHFETDWQYLELARIIHPGRYRSMLGFSQPWFVQVRTQDAFPTFRRVRQAASAGACFGPLPTAKACGRFIEILQDGFDLCRCEQLFAGGGAGCMYAQMGKCIAPCQGPDVQRIYRGMVDRACRFAAGDRQASRDELAEQMRQAAGARKYELAGRYKDRLGRLAELDEPAFAHARPVEQFQYILIQSGGGRRKLKAFLFDRGAIRPRTLDYPLVDKQLASVLSAMATFCAAERSPGRPEQERMALVSQLLFTSPARRGLGIRYDSSLTVEAMAGRIESAVDRLKVSRPKARKKVGGGAAK